MAQTKRSSRSSSAVAVPAEHALAITRTLKAPADRVFAAWTEPERLRQWMGPHGFTTTAFESDPHPGGAWRSTMRGPDGKELSQHGLVREISRPGRFAFTQKWDGQPSPETVVTIDLSERDGWTTMRFHQDEFESAEARDSHEDGWSESFDRLESYLAKAATER